MKEKVEKIIIDNLDKISNSILKASYEMYRIASDLRGLLFVIKAEKEKEGERTE